MRKYLLAAVAAAAIASPAIARDGSVYVGADIGAMIGEDSRYDFSDSTQDLDDFVVLDYSTGLDIDLNGGYDFGMFRVEGELGYKRAPADEIRINAGGAVVDSIVDTDGSTKVLSAMINGLVDIGDQDSFSGFVGAGVGLAKVKADVSFSGDFPNIPETDFNFEDSDSTMAWQVLAGVRYAVSPNIDVGFKYRYFNTGTYKFSDDSIDAELKDKWRSHSFMLSFAYNFYSPPPPPPAPPPPPPPPPPPATQTCPDGSVVLATEACPAPPPPPPPPPPAPERG